MCRGASAIMGSPFAMRDAEGVSKLAVCVQVWHTYDIGFQKGPIMRKTLTKQQLAAPFGLFCTAAAIYAVCLCACGSSSSSTTGGNATSGGNTPNASPTNTTLYTLTITNQLAWCNVSASINGNQVANFTGDSATVQATAKTTVDLFATPQAGFSPPVWTNTTNNSDPNTTYVMTAEANQTVNVYCE